MINQKALKNAIADSPYNITELSRISNISRSIINELLNGTRPNVTTGTLKRLCQTLNVSADIILGLKGVD